MALGANAVFDTSTELEGLFDFCNSLKALGRSAGTAA